MTVSDVVVVIVQMVFVLLTAPLLVGVTRKVRARFEGRVGASMLQPWRDIRKLLRKERVRPEHSSWVFLVAPLVLLVTATAAAAVVPLVSTQTGFQHAADLFAVVALLMVGTVFLALAGLDPGTAFGGMGSSREMTIAALAEPAMLVAVFGLSIPAGSTAFDRIVRHTLDNPSIVVSPQSLLAMGALAIVIIAETGRIPVDNPSTHLELTMVHEAMILEYAGPDLGVIELASHARLALLLGLFANLFLPWGIATDVGGMALLVGAVVCFAKMAVLGALLATFEVFIAKLRLFRVPELLAGAFVLSALSVTVSFFLS